MLRAFYRFFTAFVALAAWEVNVRGDEPLRDLVQTGNLAVRVDDRLKREETIRDEKETGLQLVRVVRRAHTEPIRETADRTTRKQEKAKRVAAAQN